MLEPACIERARALKRYAKSTGTPLQAWELYVTKAEAFELLIWLACTSDSAQLNVQLLREEIAKANVTDDPWPLLAEFRVEGFIAANMGELN